MRIRTLNMVGWMLLVVLLSGALGGCAALSTIREDRAVRQQFRQDVGNFFATTSEAYFILSYEYHNLAREYKAKGDTQNADVYDKKATLYYNLSKDMEKASKLFLSESLRP
jgi:hypothetical protein